MNQQFALPPAVAALDPERLAREVELLSSRWIDVIRARLVEGMRFGSIATLLSLEPEEVSRRYRSGIAQLHNRLHLGAWSGQPPAIPVVPMEARYSEMQAKSGERAGTERLAAQVALGRDYVADCSGLVAAFELSLKTFSTYSNVDQPFYPPGRDRELRDQASSLENSGTNQVVGKLVSQRVVQGDGGGFTLVDREIWPSRTHGQPPVQFTDGRAASAARRLDLLLAASDRTPIVGELKVRSDETPLYALIQLLMYAAQLATAAQLQRLREWYPGSFTETGQKVDLLIVLSEAADQSRLRQEAIDLADELSGKLLRVAGVRKRIRSIACVNLTDAGGVFHSNKRFRHT